MTIGETWPVEMRAEGIVVSFAVAQIAGAFGPAIDGALTGNGSDRTGPFIGCLEGRQRAARSLAEGVGG